MPETAPWEQQYDTEQAPWEQQFRAPQQYMDPDPGAAGYAMDGPSPVVTTANPGDGRTTTNNIRGHIDTGLNTLTLGVYPFVQAAFDDLFSDRNYSESLRGIYENMDATRRDSPITTAIAEAGGALLPAAGLMRAVGMPATTAAQGGVLGEMARGGALGGAGAATFGYADTLGRTGDTEEAARSALNTGALGAGIGAVAPLALSALPFARQAASRINPFARQETPRFSEAGLTEMSALNRRQVDEAYGLLEQSGETVRNTNLIPILTDLRTTARAAEDVELFPAGQTNLIDRMLDITGAHPEGVPLRVIERWRQDLNREINRAWEGDADANRAIALEGIRDTFDERIVQLLPNQATRDLYRTQLQIDSLLNAASRATDRAAMSNGALDYERAFQQQLVRLKNTREWSNFTEEQQALITEAIRDTSALSRLDAQMTRLLGSGLQRVMSNFAGVGATALTANPMFLAPQALSGLARSSTNRAVRGNLDEIVNSVSPASPYVPPAALQRLTAPAAINIPGALAGYRTGGGF